MKPITCIAIDDEPLALSIIARFCERRGGMELTTFSDPEQGLEAILRTRPQLVFLDIQMDEIDGLQIAGALPAGCCFIFTTAYRQYAAEGFDLDAADFLNKPFSYERFETAVEKALRRMESVRRPETGSLQEIIVKQEYQNLRIPVTDILYVEAMENYCKIFRTGGTCVLSRISLKKLLDQLPQPECLRIHRSYAVSVRKITEFNKKQILLNGTALPVGRLYREAVNRIARQR